MLDPDQDPVGHHAALEREAWRIAATGQASEVGQIVLRSVAAGIAVLLPGASAEVQTAAAAKVLLVLAQTDFGASASAMAALFLAGQNKLVAADLLAGGNMVALSERTP
ncbi:hypothetical protein [Falsiroseomonas sp. E2-1-a20]|uniref:hypothetical protein n=1 Tax=Falsiroseomonas sp. E2-1-a20 TaxID=3239300 RepID=UPI003F3C5C78